MLWPLSRIPKDVRLLRLFPIEQIVAHEAFARTFTYHQNPPPAFGYSSHMTLRVTFTPRR